MRERHVFYANILKSEIASKTMSVRKDADGGLIEEILEYGWILQTDVGASYIFPPEDPGIKVGDRIKVSIEKVA